MWTPISNIPLDTLKIGKPRSISPYLVPWKYLLNCKRSIVVYYSFLPRYTLDSMMGATCEIRNIRFYPSVEGLCCSFFIYLFCQCPEHFSGQWFLFWLLSYDFVWLILCRNEASLLLYLTSNRYYFIVNLTCPFILFFIIVTIYLYFWYAMKLLKIHHIMKVAIYLKMFVNFLWCTCLRYSEWLFYLTKNP